jgi:hypothetical protein
MSWTLARDVRFRRIFDEAVVVRQDASEVLGLNHVGLRILELIRDGVGEADMIEILTAEFEVEPEVLRGDLPDFVDELFASGVIEGAQQ